MVREDGIQIEERGKGGLEHRFWQEKIAEHYREKGYEVKIEHEIDGKSIDVYAENEKKIGAEVAMSAKGEVENIKKDLKLNLDHLIVACKDERVMSDIGMKAKDTIGREKVKEVKFKVVRDVF